MTTPRVLPFGDAAVLLELSAVASRADARRARAMAREIDALRGSGDGVAAGLGVPVAAAASVLVPFDPLRSDGDAVAGLLRPVLDRGAVAPSDADGREHVIAVRYGGADGPDLEAVARELGRTPDAVVDLHAGRRYEVLFLGFAPGFAYLGDLPDELVVPRLATPRTRVPAGSVAIAATMTAVYPHASAGGWRLIGRTDARLFDPAADPPARLRPGDQVRFEPA